jgi:hypothetical protein
LSGRENRLDIEIEQALRYISCAETSLRSPSRLTGIGNGGKQEESVSCVRHGLSTKGEARDAIIEFKEAVEHSGGSTMMLAAFGSGHASAGKKGWTANILDELT